MNNNMDIISKFNNKYLKCIVTKYSSTMNVLANSGALIIYQPNNEDTNNEYNSISYNRNYVYLGNEFLASGYGFLCKDMRDDAEKIVRRYEDDINNLKNADKLEIEERTKKDNEILEELKKYVAINGGRIDNTIVYINDKEIKTKDIILYGEEAQYKNLEITDIEVTINNDYTFANNENNIYMPLGIKVNKIDIKINYNINDSGGINKVKVIHKNLNYINQSQSTDDEDVIENIIIEYNQDVDNYYGEGTLHYQKEFKDDYEFYIDGDIKNIIEGFYIEVKETPVYKYKNYPGLERELGIELTSSGNIIKENTITVLKNVNIIAQQCLYYNFTNNPEYLENNFLLINNVTVNDNVVCNINIPENTNVIYLAIPNNFFLINLCGISKSSEKHNWLGGIKYQSNVNLLTYKNEDNNYYTSNFNVYKLYADTKFEDQYLEINLLPNNLYEGINISEPLVEPINHSNVIINPELHLNDEEFNSLYWINIKGDYSEANIKMILDSISYNGISRE